MIIVYQCPVCEERPTACLMLLYARKPIVVQCPYCSTVVEIGGKRENELRVEDVMKEVAMILKDGSDGTQSI